MKFYIGDKLYEFTEDELAFMYLDEGNEGIIYQKGKAAIKIYNDYCAKTRLDEETTIQLTKINTRRLLLPRKVVRTITGEFKGYTTNFIQGYYLNHIYDMRMQEFMDEISLYDEDIDILSAELVLIDDLIRENLKYNFGIYAVDPGSYYKRQQDEKNKIHSLNQQMLNDFVIGQIFLAAPKLTNKQKEKLVHHFEGIEDISDVMKEEARRDEKIKNYVKRIAV